MRQRAYLVVIIILLSVLLAAACQSAPAAPAPIPAGSRAVNAGSGSTTLVAFSGSIVTTTQQSFSAAVGDYASAQVWYQVDMGTLTGITATIWQSPDNSSWAESYILGPYTATVPLSYTLFTDIGRYLKTTLDISSTDTVTPAMWIVLKE